MAMTGSAYSNQIYGNQIAGAAQNGLQQAEVTTPRTISSALIRMDSLNERLASLNNQLEQIANTIGGPHPAIGGQTVPVATAAPEPNSAVHRLNGAAEYAHSQVSEAEGLINSIARSLG